MCQGPELHFHEVLLNMSLPGPRVTNHVDLLPHLALARVHTVSVRCYFSTRFDFHMPDLDGLFRKVLDVRVGFTSGRPGRVQARTEGPQPGSLVAA